MARTIKEIYDLLAAEKANMGTLTSMTPVIDTSQDLLADVTSQSKVADWRLWLWVVAYSQWLLEAILNDTKADVELLAQASKSHNLRWYANRCKAYQHGDALIWNNDNETYTYNAVNVAAQIIKRAACVQVDNVILVKVAKATTKLDVGELNAFKAYMQQIKDAGSRMIVISSNPDKVKLVVDVYYDPLVLSNTGEILAEAGQYAMANQMAKYLADLPFNGELNIVAMTDVLQQGTGILQPVIKSISVQKDGEAYAVVDAISVPYSGWFEWDFANTVINYKPRNDYN